LGHQKEKKKKQKQKKKKTPKKKLSQTSRTDANKNGKLGNPILGVCGGYLAARAAAMLAKGPVR